jgi:pimeloyl-ACP methyl ester carboxylesterase
LPWMVKVEGGTTRSLELIRDGAVLRGTETGAGPTVLLLHAGGERRAVWEPVARALHEGGVRSVAFDQRGHGDSSGEPTSLAMLADDVRAMVRQQRRPVTIVGASIGGLAALDALADPMTASRTRGLVLVDVVPDPHPDEVRAWLDERGLRRRREALVDDVLARGATLRATLAAMEMPILLVRGGAGSPLSDADVVRVRETNPRVRVERVPEAGHLVARDAPRRLATLIVEAL